MTNELNDFPQGSEAYTDRTIVGKPGHIGSTLSLKILKGEWTKMLPGADWTGLTDSSVEISRSEKN